MNGRRGHGYFDVTVFGLLNGLAFTGVVVVDAEIRIGHVAFKAAETKDGGVEAELWAEEDIMELIKG